MIPYGNDLKIADIKVLSVESNSSDPKVNVLVRYYHGEERTFRVNVRNLHDYYYYARSVNGFMKATTIGRVYCGFLRTDARILFIVRLRDGTADLVQTKEGTTGANELLALVEKYDEQGNESGTYYIEPESTPSPKEEDFVEDLDIPVVILPNLYSLNISNVALKHIRSRISERLVLDYVTLKCKVNYQLHGRKEGKRKIIFTSYNDKDEVVEIRGDHLTYKFTEVGYEFVEACFDDYDKKPISKITISVREI